MEMDQIFPINEKSGRENSGDEWIGVVRKKRSWRREKVKKKETERSWRRKVGEDKRREA